MGKISSETILVILGVLLIIYGHPIVGIFLLLFALGFFAA